MSHPTPPHPAAAAIRIASLAAAVLSLAVAGCQAPRSVPITDRQPTASPARTTQPAVLTDEQRAANVRSFEEMWNRVAATYFQPARLTGGTGRIDWNAIHDEFRPKVEAATTADEARDLMNQALSRLNETHFGVLAADAIPESGDDDNAESKPGDVGITLRLIDGQPTVFSVEPNSSADRAGVKPGWTLLAVDGKPVTKQIESAREALGDTPLGTAKLTGLIDKMLDVDLGESLAATFADGSDQSRTVDLVGQKPAGNVARLGTNLPPMNLRIAARTLPGNIGYFSLSIFLDPPRVMPAYQSFIRSHETARGIVIDLRGNHGGLGAMATGMCGFLLNEDGKKLGTMVTRDASVHFVVNPRFPRYEGPVAVLVDGLSMSTSEIMAGGLQDLKRARIFGQRTPGAALPSTVVRLTNGDRFQYAVADYISQGGKRLEGVGVTPDEPVPLTREDLLAGRDRTLEAALAWIGQQPTPATRPAGE